MIIKKNLSSFNRDALADICNELNLLGNAAEIGVYKGDFSLAFLQRWKGNKLFLVDKWNVIQNSRDSSVHGLSRHELIQNMVITLDKLKNYEGKFVMLRADSVESSYFFSDGFFDFIYIDASHDYQSVKNDIDAWYPKVRKGGILAGHDYISAMRPSSRIQTFTFQNLAGSLNHHNYTKFEVKKAVDEFAEKNNKDVYIIEGYCRFPSWLIFC